MKNLDVSDLFSGVDYSEQLTEDTYLVKFFDEPDKYLITIKKTIN